MGMYLDNAMLTDSTHELVKQSYSIIKLPDNMPDLEEWHRLYRLFIERHAGKDEKNWQFTIPGEHEPDVGLIAPRPGKDIKWFFHYNNYFKNQIAPLNISLEDRIFFAYCEEVSSCIREIGKLVCKKLDELYDFDISDSYDKCFDSFSPYSVSTMRGLFYPAVQNQFGAKAHPDRGLFAIHLGDKGGNLIALDGPDDQVGRIISPKSGEAVIFWGVKSLWVTKGRCKPLWHKSTTLPNVDRMALVGFYHVDICDYLVLDAVQAEKDFYDKFQLRSNRWSNDYYWNCLR